jgi:competence protein ComEA
MMKTFNRVVCVVLLSLALFCQPVLALDKININMASIEQLVELKGIGEKTAVKIVEYRKEHGDFATVDDLANVKGIGDKKLEALRDQLTVGKE